MSNINELWDHVLTEMELSVSKANYNMWLKETFAIREDDGTIVVGVPNDFVRQWLSDKFHKDILRAARQHNDTIRGIEYLITKKGTVIPQEKKSTLHPAAITLQSHHELPLINLPNRKDNLNPRYTFQNFVIGPFNEIAYSAAQATLERPGTYNPLFIYGSTGLGKTHLIQAIGNEFKNKFPNSHVYYISSEKFQMDYVAAVQANKIAQFKEKYRTYDVLIMDDVQFLAGKERTQEELFHLFNILYDRNKQTIFSSDKHPNFVTGLEERLKSRFTAGMVVDISKPGYESRLAIMQSKAREHGIEISADVLDYIASNVEGNIRELEGIIHSIMVQIGLRKTPLSLEEAKSIIKNNIKPKRSVPVEDIIKIITHFYNIDESLIYEKTRRKEVVHCRQVAMFILREDFSISFPLIGRKFGGRDHTTVIHSCEKIKQDIKDNTSLLREIEQIRAIIAV